MVVHTNNPSMWDVEAGRWRVRVILSYIMTLRLV